MLAKCYWFFPLWVISYNLGSSFGYETMENGVDTCFNTCVLRPPLPLNLPELRHVSYLQEKYFHFGFTFSFVLMLNEMYSLVQITCGIIVCRELCLLRHNTLPNRHTNSWLFMTDRFLRSLKHLFQGTLPNCPVFLPRQFNGRVDLWIYILGLNSANTYFL